MATVNLSNSGWSTSTTTSDIEIDINSERIKFEMDSHAETAGYAKVYIAIDPSKYSSVTFQYSQQNHDGIRDLWFGIWDSEDASSKAGTIGIHSSADTKWSESGGSVTMSVPNSSSTKYVGLRFYGREDTTTTYGVSTRVFTPSLTATTRGYTLTYDANGGSGAPSVASNITSTTISSTKPTRSGYDFLGWSKSSSATSASYVAGNSISLSSNITLYAVWRKFYTVTYNANGGSDAPSSDKKIKGENLTLNSSSPTPMEDSSETYTVTFNANGGTCDQYMTTINHVVTYKFTNWNTKSDGSGTSYQPGGSYTNDSNMTLYAQYTSTTAYNSVALPTPFRDNYDFLGWSTNEYDTSGITGEYTPTEDTTLYAIWKIKGQVYICDKLGGYSPYKVLIRDSSGWNQYVPYIYTYSGWEIYSG